MKKMLALILSSTFALSLGACAIEEPGDDLSSDPSLNDGSWSKAIGVPVGEDNVVTVECNEWFSCDLSFWLSASDDTIETYADLLYGYHLEEPRRIQHRLGDDYEIEESRITESFDIAELTIRNSAGAIVARDSISLWVGYSLTHGTSEGFLRSSDGSYGSLSYDLDGSADEVFFIEIENIGTRSVIFDADARWY